MWARAELAFATWFGGGGQIEEKNNLGVKIKKIEKIRGNFFFRHFWESFGAWGLN